jgi:hypothetical protein
MTIKSLRRWIAPLLFASLPAMPAAAISVDPAGVCGNLHAAEVVSLVAPATNGYVWVQTALTSTLITVKLVVTVGSTTKTYDGFQCRVTGGSMTAIPYGTSATSK